MGNPGCLLTWANWLVHDLRKCYTKFRTSKFRPGIAVNICTNQFHSPEKGPANLKSTGTKDGFEAIWNMNFCLEHSIRKNRTVFSDVSLLLEIFN